MVLLLPTLRQSRWAGTSLSETYHPVPSTREWRSSLTPSSRNRLKLRGRRRGPALQWCSIASPIPTMSGQLCARPRRSVRAP